MRMITMRTSMRNTQEAWDTREEEEREELEELTSLDSQPAPVFLLRPDQSPLNTSHMAMDLVRLMSTELSETDITTTLPSDMDTETIPHGTVRSTDTMLV